MDYFLSGDQCTVERYDGRPYAENSCARSNLESTYIFFTYPLVIEIVNENVSDNLYPLL